MRRHHLALTEQDPSGLTQDQIEDLEAEFASKQTIINIACLPIGIAFLLLAHAALVSLSQFMVDSDGIAGYRVPYQVSIWWLFPGFGAICLCFEIALQIWALFAGPAIVNLYCRWESKQPKKTRYGGVTYYDTRKTLRWLALLIGLPVGILTALALNMHTTSGDDGLTEFGYAFKAPVFHRYSEIRGITVARGVFGKHGKFIAKPSFVLDFVDGHRWSQRDWDDSRRSIQMELSGILTDKTNLPFMEAETAEDAPRL